LVDALLRELGLAGADINGLATLVTPPHGQEDNARPVPSAREQARDEGPAMSGADEQRQDDA
jgi:hypothetical protein